MELIKVALTCFRRSGDNNLVDASTTAARQRSMSAIVAWPSVVNPPSQNDFSSLPGEL